jgi:acetyl-CoA synthetase
MASIAWRPDERTRSRAQLTRFLHASGISSFDELYRYSISDIPGFTEQVLQFLDIPFHHPYSAVVDLSRGLPWPKWCVGAGLNISSACLRTSGNQIAVIWEGEEGHTRTLTYEELEEQTEAAAAGFRSLGLEKGDPIAIHLPMVPETVVALLAAARMGAVAVPLFSGYGPSAIESRIRDVGARAVVTCDAFPRRGQPVPAQAVIEQVRPRCPTLEHVIVVSRMAASGSGLSWDDLLTGAAASPEPTSAEDPVIVLYTSGTTGRPKGILHTHCGFPVKSAQDMSFGMDVGPGTRVCWITDIGWMMGPWLIYGTTILGGTIVLYDGAPDYPGPARLWEICERHRVEVVGVSPTLVRALAAQGLQLARGADLSSVRIFGSTGEPWNPEPWWWLFEQVGGGRVPIINYSGGTEISGGILCGNPLLPVKPCSFPAPCPGIAADIVDEQGRSVPAGAVGELVIRKPWIGMARGFLNDPQRYLETYWSRWPDIWAHGDWAQRDEEGHWYILGRSDDTLKIAGKRVGPAEVESILVGHPDVVEAAVIGAPHEIKGECLIAFCVLGLEASATDDLRDELRSRVGAELGKPLRPEKIHFVPALPKTRNAKVMRRVIRAAYLNQDAGDLSALENPAAVETIRLMCSGRREVPHDGKSPEDQEYPSR